MTRGRPRGTARASRRRAPRSCSPARSSPTRRWTCSTSTQVDICPWALREGVILRRLDQLRRRRLTRRHGAALGHRTLAAWTTLTGPHGVRDQRGCTRRRRRSRCRPSAMLSRRRAAAVRAGRRPRVRRGRGHGQHRHREPGRRSRCAALSDHYEIPVLSVHAPCLLLTQRVWGTDPWGKIDKAREVAERARRPHRRRPPAVSLAARRTRRDFVEGVATRTHDGETDRDRGREHVPVAGGQPGDARVRARLGPARRGLPPRSRSTSRTLRCPGPTRWRWPRTWASGCRTCTSPTAPARPATSTSSRAAATSRARSCWTGWPGAWFTGTVVVEVSTRGAADRDEQESDLAEALAFARLNLVVPAERYAGP